MSAPVIDPTSSVLSYPQWLTWQFIFSASNSPNAWSVASGGFPTGMSFQPSLAATGSSGTNIITASDNTYTNGTVVVFAALTGGAPLAAGTLYYVTGLNTDGTFSLATSAGGSPISLTSDITSALLIQPGLLTGFAMIPGIYNVEMVASNGTGGGVASSAPVLFTIGIEAAAAAPDTNADIIWDFAANAIIVQTSATLNLTPAPRATPILYVKEQDDLIIRLRLVKNGTILDPVMGDNGLVLVLKQYEPDGQIVVSDASVEVGTGDSSSLLLHAKFNGNALAAALSNYEQDAGTFFPALAEFELTFPNPGYSIGPDTFVRTSPTFTIQIERDLGEVA